MVLEPAGYSDRDVPKRKDLGPIESDHEYCQICEIAPSLRAAGIADTHYQLTLGHICVSKDIVCPIPTYE